MDHAKVRAILARGISLAVSGMANSDTKWRHTDTLLYSSELKEQSV
jgi:hypothetical protein